MTKFICPGRAAPVFRHDPQCRTKNQKSRFHLGLRSHLYPCAPKICTYTRRTQLNEPHFSCTLVIFVWRPDKCPYCLTSDLRANFPTTEVVTVITAKLKKKYNQNNVLKFNELLNRIIAQKTKVRISQIN